eukprot:5339098-Pleurochrysis_carterae.AAC.2
MPAATAAAKKKALAARKTSGQERVAALDAADVAARSVSPQEIGVTPSGSAAAVGGEGEGDEEGDGEG